MLLLSFLRLFVFHLYESPKYLMGRGRDADAVAVVHAVARFNGKTSRLTLQMLQDVEKTVEGEGGDGRAGDRVPMDTSARGALVRKLKVVSGKHVKSLFATRKLAYSTTLLMLVWGGSLQNSSGSSLW